MPQFWIISIGYLFVAVNFQINGLGLLLPTCLGYALIAGASWSLRDVSPVFQVATLPAAVLGVITIPDVVRGAMDTGEYHYWAWWPSLILEIALFVLIAIGLWLVSQLKGIHWLRWAAIASAPILVIALLSWQLIPVTSNATLIASFLIYEVPSFYLAAVNYGAAKSVA